MTRGPLSRAPLLIAATRRVLPVLALASALGCASWNPLAIGKDPMEAELERLEADQQRMARQQRSIEEAEEREREEVPQTMEGRLQRGDQYLASGDVASALWEYAAAHRVEPASPEPAVRLGYVHLRVDPDRARPLFESALERDPDHVSAHVGLGLSMLSGGERDAGIAHLERAVELAPDSAKALAALGVSLDQLGRHEEARVHLDRAHELRPRDTRIMNNLAVAYLRAGRPERAERLLRAALRHDTQDEALRSNNLGMALAMQGRFDEALEAFRRAGDEQSARSNLGYAHYLRGEYEEAIEQYERALVAGGDASVQVVRNLKAARQALESAGGAGPEPVGPQVADEDPPPTPAVVTPGETPGADPWLREAPPAARGGE